MARKEKGRYVIADVVINGQRRRPHFATIEEAQAYERDAINQAYTVGKMFPEFARDMWGGTKDERNALRITDELVKRLGKDKHIVSIKTSCIEDMTDSLRKLGNKASTINSKLTRLSSLMKKAQRKGIIENVPLIPLQKGMRKRDRYLTDEEIEALFNVMPPVYREFSRFLLATGCRVSEALKLTWQDVQNSKVWFKDTKNGASRVIPQTAEAKAALAWFKARDPITPFAEVVYVSYYHAWLRARKAVGLAHDRDVIPHILRHTCASRLVQNGAHLMKLQHWLGHKTLSQTARYSHLAHDSLNELAEMLNRR